VKGRYFFLLNSDAWVVGDGLQRLVDFADAHPDAAVVGPKLLNTDGSLQRSVRGEPTVWRVATEYLFIRKLAPRTNLLNPLYAGGFDHATARAVDWVSGAALLVRRAATEAVGLFDESFFLFSEEVDWMTRFRHAGWKVFFCPDAEVVHVGGASHGGRMYVENLRGQLRYFDKHQGPQEAERLRRMLLVALRLRAVALRRPEYSEAVRWLRDAHLDPERFVVAVHCDASDHDQQAEGNDEPHRALAPRTRKKLTRRAFRRADCRRGCRRHS